MALFDDNTLTCKWSSKCDVTVVDAESDHFENGTGTQVVVVLLFIA